MIYDCIIIGGGPAGLSASIYASRHRMKHLVFEGNVVGGQIASAAHPVENYPGLPGLTGQELAKRMEEHARKLGMELKMERVTGIVRKENGFVINTDSGTYETRTVILATGGMHRHLGIPGEDVFLGKGVSYCATCDAPFFKDKVVAVVGGGNSALSQSLYLADIAKKVYLIHRRKEFRAEEAFQDKVKANPKIDILYDSVVKEIKGDECVKSVFVENVVDKSIRELPVDGLFIYIGNVPSSALAKGLGVELTERGYIKVDERMRTNVPGVYAAGDITGHTLQVVVACAQGAIAVMDAYMYLKKGGAGGPLVNR